MTLFAYAMYKYAAGLMTADERATADRLAKQADAGDRLALGAFRELTLDVIADANNRQRSKAT